jgi:DNA topoisomerase-1
LASLNYPDIKTCVNLDKKGGLKYPTPPPLQVDSLLCEKCESPMYLRRGKKGPWLGCSTFPKCKGRMGWKTLEESVLSTLESALELHEQEHPQVIIKRMDGTVIPEGTPVGDLLLPGGVAELELYET